MTDAHFHLHSSPVSRGKGHSAVAAAAYQANQKLTHAQQRQFSVSLDYRKDLKRETVSEALRQAFLETPLFTAALQEAQHLNANDVSEALRTQFAQHDAVLSDRLRVYPRNDGFTLRDNGNKQTYHLRQETDGLTVSRRNGIRLSAHAEVHKLGRREWEIVDRSHTYRVKEYRQTIQDRETGKQVVVKHVLDVYGDQVHDYRRKGDVIQTWVQAPANAPEWIQAMAADDGLAIEKKSRERLWNAAEAADTSRVGRPARKLELSLLRELTYDENTALVRQFVQEQLVDKGLVADVAVHSKQASDGFDNTHVHVLFTTREFDESGEFVRTKRTYWNKEARIHEWREAWATLVNTALERKDSAARVDHRSYEARGVDKVPGEHLGAQQWGMEERGVETQKGKKNHAIRYDYQVGNVLDSYAPHTELSEDHTSTQPESLTNPTQDSPHQQAVGGYLHLLTVRSLHAHAELINRIESYGRKILDKAQAMGRSVFTRFTQWRDRVPQRERTQGHER